MNSLFRFGFITLFYLTSLSVFGDNQEFLASAFKSFKTGSYKEAVSFLEKIKTRDHKLLGTKFYLKGMCHNRMQRFDLAMEAFQKAQRFNNETRDLNYELGQAYFANSELEKARESFLSSYKIRYKSPMSLYYVAHISQILEEHLTAKKYYLTLLTHQKKLPKKERDLKLSQVAQFQLSESLVALAEEKNEHTAKEKVKNQIIPLMKKAIKIMPKAPISADIEKRIKDLEKKYYLDPNLMKNGKKLSDKRMALSFTQDITYDSNITLSTNQSSSQATQKDSYIHYSTLSWKYTGQIANRFILKPNAKFKNTVHSDRVNSVVYKNDAYNISGGLNSSREGKMFGKKSSTLFNVDYSYIAQDYNSEKHRRFFSRATTYTLGQKFKYFNAGNTSFKIKFKDYYGYLETLHKRTKTFSADQLIITKSGKLLILLFQGDFGDNYNNISSSTNTYLLRVDWLAPEFWPKYTLNFAMALTLTDTKLQSATRGTEKTYNPSVKVTKKVDENISLTVGFSYTRNTSLDKASYDYAKHATNFEFKYEF